MSWISPDFTPPGGGPPKITTGMFFNGFGQRNEGQTVFGAQVATDGFHHALIRHGRSSDYEFYTSSSNEKGVQSMIQDLLDRSDLPHPSIRVLSQEHLFRASEEPRFNVWYDPGANIRKCYHLRSLRTRPL